jgi:hypothetical protein
MRLRSLFPSVAVLFLLAWPAGSPGAVRSQLGPTIPAPPQILETSKAPQTAAIMKQLALTYAPGMTSKARDQDFLTKVRLAKKLLGVGKLVDLRHQSLNLRAGVGEVSWEEMRRRHWPDGDQVGVTLSVPVWIPPGARRLMTYCGFAKKWQTVAHTTPRRCGFVWHAAKMSQINDKARYHPQRLQFEINSKFAPLAGLLLEYIFREGYYDISRRVPLMVVRGGEDTYAVRADSIPVSMECLSFPDNDGDSLKSSVAVCRFGNLAEIYHGEHSPTSNHRLGLALDLNDYNFRGNGVVDGTPNPISRATRQYNRDAMHRLDARQMPAWVYTAAKWLGCRLPQEWVYYGYHTDWEHVDVGTK